MTLKGDAKFKGKLTCSLKSDLRNLVNFHASSRKSGNFHFDGLFLSKAYKYLARWNGKEELCPITLKGDTKFEEKLTLGSKNKRAEELSLMTLKRDPNFEEKLTFCLKIYKEFGDL